MNSIFGKNDAEKITKKYLPKLWQRITSTSTKISNWKSLKSADLEEKNSADFKNDSNRCKYYARRGLR